MIKPPEWAIHAYPTYKGWINLDNNQLLVESPTGGFSDDQINEYKSKYRWHGIINEKGKPQNCRITNEDWKKLKEEESRKIADEESKKISLSKPIEKMNKTELVEYAVSKDIEVSNLTKKQIIAKLKEADLA